MTCWKRYILSNFRKWSICSFFLSNGNYRFSKKIPGLLNSCLNVLTVFYTLKYSTDNFFDWCVHFAKISAIQRNWQARIFFQFIILSSVRVTSSLSYVKLLQWFEDQFWGLLKLYLWNVPCLRGKSLVPVPPLWFILVLWLWQSLLRTKGKFSFVSKSPKNFTSEILRKQKEARKMKEQSK